MLILFMFTHSENEMFFQKPIHPAVLKIMLRDYLLIGWTVQRKKD